MRVAAANTAVRWHPQYIGSQLKPDDDASKSTRQTGGGAVRAPPQTFQVVSHEMDDDRHYDVDATHADIDAQTSRARQQADPAMAGMSVIGFKGRLPANTRMPSAAMASAAALDRTLGFDAADAVGDRVVVGARPAGSGEGQGQPTTWRSDDDALVTTMWPVGDRPRLPPPE